MKYKIEEKVANQSWSVTKPETFYSLESVETNRKVIRNQI